MQGRTLSEHEVESERIRLATLALVIVDTEGREACSLRRLAAEAGTSRTAPYSYFANKEALLDAVRVAAIDQLSDACERAMHDATAGLTEPLALAAAQLRGLGHAYVVFALQRPALYALVFDTPPGGRDHVAATTRYRGLSEAPLTELRRLGMSTLPPERLAHVLWAATHGIIGLHRAGKLNHGLEFETVLQDLRDTLAFGFVPRRDSGASS